jgi:hypothetical protein
MIFPGIPRAGRPRISFAGWPPCSRRSAHANTVLAHDSNEYDGIFRPELDSITSNNEISPALEQYSSHRHQSTLCPFGFGGEPTEEVASAWPQGKQQRRKKTV